MKPLNMNLCLFVLGALMNHLAQTSRLSHVVYNETAVAEVLEDIRQTCPLEDICRTDKHTSPDSLNSCCLDCFCDERCPLFGDCCPGVELNEEQLNTALLECKRVDIWARKRIDPIVVLRPWYRLIDECPSDIHGDENIAEKCTGDFNYTDFDEIVFVSDLTGTTYKNKYCAQCNGVIDAIRWDLVIGSCLLPIENQQLSSAETKQFILDNCDMYSARSEHLPYNRRTMACTYHADCLHEEAYQYRIDGCKLATGSLESPYIATMSQNTSALCYKCDFISEYKSCKKGDTGFRDIDKHNSYSLFLNMKVENMAPGGSSLASKCGEAFVFDDYTRNCKRLYCPPFHVVSYGKCIPLAINDLKLQLALSAVMPIDTNLTEHTTADLSSSVTNYFWSNKDALDGIFVLANCNPLVYKLSAMTEETLGDCLVLSIVHETNETCPVSRLVNGVLKLPVQFALPTFSPNVEERLNTSAEWTLTFAKLNEVEEFASVYQSNEPFRRSQPHRLSSFFLCPYIVLNMTEYKAYVDEKGVTHYNTAFQRKPRNCSLKQAAVTRFSLKSDDDCHEDVEMFEPTMKTLAGFYPISKTEIAVCLDTYFVADSVSLTRLGSIDFILVVLTCVRFIVWY